jgi:benzoate/toluate 1,2-dioxygenase beta subunit
VYWVPATTDADIDPDRHISHIYDNRARIDTRVKLLQTGHRLSQVPASLMRRLISNIDVTAGDSGELVAESNFILAEFSIQGLSFCDFMARGLEPAKGAKELWGFFSSSRW